MTTKRQALRARTMVPVAATVLLVLLVSLAPTALTRATSRAGIRAQTAVLRCIADANVSSYEGETRMNYGAATRIRLKGIQMLGLMRFDLAPCQTWRVERAVLRLRYAGADQMLRTLGFSTIAAPWEEGDASGAEKPGAMCFDARSLDRSTWDGAGTDLTDVMFGRGFTRQAFADVHVEADGWFSVDVSPEIVQDMIAGISHGMAVTDEKGQTMANNDVYAREQSASAPTLTVTGMPANDPVPGKVVRLLASPLRDQDAIGVGACTLTVVSPRQGRGLRIQYRSAGETDWTLLPRSRTPLPVDGRESLARVTPLRPLTDYRFRVQSIGETGVPGPAQDCSGHAPAGFAAPNAIAARTGWVAASLRSGAHGAVLACSPDLPIDPREQRPGAHRASAGAFVVHTSRGGHAEAQIVVAPTALPASVSVSPPLTMSGERDAKPTRILASVNRLWYVNDGKWVPEVCVPMPPVASIPWLENRVPEQRNQAFLWEAFIPPHTAPGAYVTRISISFGTGAPVVVPLRVIVHQWNAPSRLGFQVSLNTYGTVGGPYGLDDRTEEYRSLERQYHRMAHSHRACLAALGYAHNGNITSNYAPPLVGVGRDRRVASWAEWDRQFGPYFDGSAFAGLPRGASPDSHFYLPIHEAWPSDIRAHYQYAPTTREYPLMVSEHAMKAPAIEASMAPAFAEEMTAVASDIARHLTERGWTRTSFQTYFNNKHYYKDPKSGGRGTSWWLLDEPMNRDDWMALRYFLKAVRSGAPVGSTPIVTREDVSRPQWQRDTLDGLVDLMVVSSELARRAPLMSDMRRRWGVRFWQYGEAPPPRAPASDCESWAMSAWLAGADGIVPWQSVGGDAAFEKPEATALLYPGKRFGLQAPLASVRLKALRRAQLDAELLAAVARRRGWTRLQTAHALRSFLPKLATVDRTSGEDAGTYRFKGGPYDDLRRALLTQLDRSIGP